MPDSAGLVIVIHRMGSIGGNTARATSAVGGWQSAEPSRKLALIFDVAPKLERCLVVRCSFRQ